MKTFRNVINDSFTICDNNSIETHYEGFLQQWINKLNNTLLINNERIEIIKSASESICAVADGDFSKKVTGNFTNGDLIDFKDNINTMIDQITSFANSIRVYEDYSQGKFGGSFYVPGLSGSWKNIFNSSMSLLSLITTYIRNSTSGIYEMLDLNFSNQIYENPDIKGELKESQEYVVLLKNNLKLLVENILQITKEMENPQNTTNGFQYLIMKLNMLYKIYETSKNSKNEYIHDVRIQLENGKISEIPSIINNWENLESNKDVKYLEGKI